MGKLCCSLSKSFIKSRAYFPLVLPKAAQRIGMRRGGHIPYLDAAISAGGHKDVLIFLRFRTNFTWVQLSTANREQAQPMHWQAQLLSLASPRSKRSHTLHPWCQTRLWAGSPVGSPADPPFIQSWEAGWQALILHPAATARDT